MRYEFTDGKNPNFAALCRLLDEQLNQWAGGEENRKEYIQYNTLEKIHDVVIAYDGDHPVGCAAFKKFDETSAELKRVFVRDTYRGTGVAEAMVRAMEERARSQGYDRLVLETGKALLAANKLYKRLSYQVIENYGQYQGMTGSVCMQKIL